MVWDVAEREDSAIAADLVSRAWLRERSSKGRKQQVVLHVVDVSAIRATSIEIQLEELGKLLSISQPRVNSDNPYSESLYSTAKYQSTFPRQSIASAKRPATGWRRSWSWTTSGTAIGALSSCLLTSATKVMQ